MDQVGTTAEAHVPGLASATHPRIYYLHPLQAGPLDGWALHLDRAAALGFTHVLTAPVFAADDIFLPEDFSRLHPALRWPGDAVDGLRRIAALCRERKLQLLMDVVADRVGMRSPLVRERADLFTPPDPDVALDPRRDATPAARAHAEAENALLAAFWAGMMNGWREAGVAGYRLLALGRLHPMTLRALIAAARHDGPCLFLGWTPELTLPQLRALAGTGLDFSFSSLPYWDFRADWLWTEAEILRRIGGVIACAEAPFGPRVAASQPDATLRPAVLQRAARFAAAFGDGWLMPMGFEFASPDQMDARRDAPGDLPPPPPFDLAATIRAANAEPATGNPKLLSGPGADGIAFRRGERLILTNAALNRAASLSLGAIAENVTLAPGEVRELVPEPTQPVPLPRHPLGPSAAEAAGAPRIGIEQVAPSVDDGRFPAKRLTGEIVTVEADVVCDGHDQLGVALLWRPADEAQWREARMRPLVNDRWQASFPLARAGRHLFTIEAWRDAFASYRDELGKKHRAGVDVTLELREGRALVDAAVARVPGLQPVLARLDSAAPAEQVAILLAEETARLMADADERPFAVRLDRDRPVDAEREAAAFGSWYEIFPRSMSDDEHRHGTFRDVIRHLPRIRDMGFDVLYFPPVHPIGRTNRKGRNNSLHPAPDDPGSPYAIGGPEGGHDALHPELGTLADFQALREAAAAHGLELALDFAIQCSPDHPWLKQHPDWFDWRPDGSLKYAENPPKKYEDIVNVDFYARGAVPGLWVALAEVVLFWCGQGVRIFRVDNPHTKPFPFWEWLIAEVRARHPDAIFLAEAFTRPKIMNRLAKLGFTQSYTYFTWRNSRRELQEYLTELTTTAPREFFRPHFFVNTPDINPVFLQTSGRPGFLIRAALAATLSGLWGVYCGFELCEGTPLPGREEYLDSEKFQLRAWDWERPGNIVAEITELNRIRRLNPALHSHLGVTFLPAANEAILLYEKATPDRSNVLIVAVSLDPMHRQEAAIELPLWRWHLPDSGTLHAEDLLRRRMVAWHGKWQRITLDPAEPYAIWRAAPAQTGPA
ncbi:Alpha-1,4-glucan:maltose-1-phosphate maltosyltransferase [Rhodovastum atsumiense]|uniref:Alpha-1,4-glucan:maltose-1-phosphate maltosyltransferase n=1 Tax=Rhodovastum atsumiense TaxID=504468 RepID=A0A5M6IQJ9_9PROT|nr:maltotransferase domain-containing protein [Rhodovastum atsumiense]KAA5610542.1 DUF3416 domain-containing protein [Rhodovastum atsumiense]CAH2605007.1 Alpha-1,4-glucan:maltose-1-phosphate maltosyltransferase [Rhodovastum atsumiense]